MYVKYALLLTNGIILRIDRTKPILKILIVYEWQNWIILIVLS